MKCLGHNNILNIQTFINITKCRLYLAYILNLTQRENQQFEPSYRQKQCFG